MAESSIRCFIDILYSQITGKKNPEQRPGFFLGYERVFILI